MRKRELYSLIGSVIAPIVASVAAAFVFGWLTMYSVVCERDVSGMLWAEKKGEEEK